MENKENPKTKRVKNFRERLADASLSRYEIYASDDTKKAIREIAKAEELSTGVAAEALIQLGIEQYKTQKNLSIESVNSVVFASANIQEASPQMALNSINGNWPFTEDSISRSRNYMASALSASSTSSSNESSTLASYSQRLKSNASIATDKTDAGTTKQATLTANLLKQIGQKHQETKK